MTLMQEEIVKSSFFAGMPDKVSRRMVTLGSEMTIPAGGYLLHEGDPARHMYLLLRGRLSIEMHVHHKGAVTLETLGPGDAVGWSWVVGSPRYKFDGRAQTDLSAFAFPADTLRLQCESDHEFGYHLTRALLAVMAHRLEAARLRLLDMYGAPK